MLAINNVATQDNFAPALTLESPRRGGKLSLVVANAAVICQLRGLPDSASGTSDYSAEFILVPQIVAFNGISGCRFRSAVAGTPARIVATISEPSLQDFEPVPGGTPFASTLTPGGGINPGIGAMQILLDGILAGTEVGLNFQTPTGTPLTVTDNPGSQRVDVLYKPQLARLNATLLVADGNVDFQSIPATFRDLLLVIQARSVGAVATADLDLRFNGDSGANYDYHRINNLNATVTGVAQLADTMAEFFSIPGASATANFAGPVAIWIPNYAGTTFAKNAIGFAGAIDARAAGTNWRMSLVHCQWASVGAAINRIQVSSNSFASGLKTASMVSLYGLNFF